MHRKSDFFRFQEKGLEVSLGRNIVLLRLSCMMTSQVLFWRYSVSWHQNQTVALFFQLKAYLCLNSRYATGFLNTWSVGMEKMDAHHHVCPKKSTQNDRHLRIWPPVISSNWSWRVKDPGKKQKMMLSNKSSNLQQLSFFRMQKKVCVCVCVCVCVVVFPTKKSYECDENLFPGRPVEFNSLPIHMLHGFVFSQERMSRVYHFATTDLVPCSLFAKKRYYTICHNREWNSDFEHMIGIPTLASSWEYFSRTKVYKF